MNNQTTKVTTIITIESLTDTELQAQMALSDIEKTLQVCSINAQLPAKGCNSVQYKYGQVHQLVCKSDLQDNESLRLRFLHCNEWVILEVKLPVSPAAELASEIPAFDASLMSLPNQNECYPLEQHHLVDRSQLASY
jgi:hypothetical protein